MLAARLVHHVLRWVGGARNARGVARIAAERLRPTCGAAEIGRRQVTDGLVVDGYLAGRDPVRLLHRCCLLDRGTGDATFAARKPPARSEQREPPETIPVWSGQFLAARPEERPEIAAVVRE